MNSCKITRSAYNVLVQVKLDASRLHSKISDRLEEYIFIFAAKRTREHFKHIFSSRYDSVGISDLKECASETIFAIDAFYNKVDDTWWYLQHTEDMPGTMEDRLRKEVKEIGKLYHTLQLHIDAEFSSEADEFEEEVDFEEVPEISEIEDE